MEIALFFVTIFCMYSSIMAWVFYEENKRLQSKNDELVEKLDVKLKEKSTLMVELKGLKELTTQDLLTRIKSLENYLDLSFNSVTDGCIVNWFHEPNENNSGGFIDKCHLLSKKDFRDVLFEWQKLTDKEVEEVKQEQKDAKENALKFFSDLNKEIDLIESKLKMELANKFIDDITSFIKLRKPKE